MDCFEGYNNIECRPVINYKYLDTTGTNKCFLDAIKLFQGWHDSTTYFDISKIFQKLLIFLGIFDVGHVTFLT